MPYIQPPVVKPCKPVGQICTSCAPMDTCTVYKKSYCPCERPCRQQPVHPSDHLPNPPCEPVEACTIYKKSFCPPCVSQRSPPIVPCDHLGSDQHCKMDDCTIHKLSFPCHPCAPRAAPCLPRGLLSSTPGLSECCSVMQASYLPPCCVQRTQSCKPVEQYCAPCQPFENETVARLSYQAWPVPKKQLCPWAGKTEFCAPSAPMDCRSVYRCSFIEPGQYV